MLQRFVNRERELKILKERLKSNSFEFLVIYGRRRVGKTALILESVKNREYIYYLATEKKNLEKFKEICAQKIKNFEDLKNDWEAYFRNLKNKIIIIDEFPNLIKESSNVLSELQRIVDLTLAPTKTKIILCGSRISMMESKVLSYQSPLYGRRTSQLKLKPMNFYQTRGFFPKLSLEKLVQIYGFSDGIPFYLEKVRTPFWKWLGQDLNKEDSFIRTEVDFLLKYEFQDVSTYKEILEAIAFGNTKINEIKNYTKLKATDISPYIKNLILTDFVEKRISIFERPKSRKARYYLKDNFLRFWFRFIYPNLSLIEERVFNVDKIKREYNQYLGLIFEKAVRDFLILRSRKILDFEITNIGKYWGKRDDLPKGRNEFEIDLIAAGEDVKKVAFFEIKWKEFKKEEDLIRAIQNLKTLSKFFPRQNEERKKRWGIFAKRIPDKIKEKLRRHKYLIYDLEDMRTL